MKLNAKDLKEIKKWEEAGYSLPQYNLEKFFNCTKENPKWVHLGAGNIFRAFLANVSQTLLNLGVTDCGLIAAEGYDEEIIENIYRPHDNLGILVTLKADGKLDKTVIASVAESLIMDAKQASDFARLKDIMTKESLQMLSFTITEKGYSLVDGKGELLSSVKQDFAGGPNEPTSYMGKVTSLLYQRFLARQQPIAMVSMDNCSHNGDKLQAAVFAFAKEWEQNGLVEKGFFSYVENRNKVSFPWTMIDKITPRPDDLVLEVLRKDGIEGMEPVITSKNTYTAAFVNAEECEYLVVEDWFPAGHPPLEKAGILFTDRQTVDLVEKMKVCTCLNPLHTALAVFGCLLGYESIAKEMENPLLKKLVEKIGYEEGLKVVADPKILNPKEFIGQVINNRLPNPFMPDTPQRIATDTSQKLPIRYGETIKAYQKSECLQVDDLEAIPFVFAGWLRYLMGVDDSGKQMQLSPDPMLETLCPVLQNIKIGDTIHAAEILGSILSKETIFGVDLFQVGMAEKVCKWFEKMITSPGAVKQCLEECV